MTNVGKHGSGINMLLSNNIEKKSITNLSSVNQGNANNQSTQYRQSSNQVQPQQQYTYPQQQFSSQYTNQSQQFNQNQQYQYQHSLGNPQMTSLQGGMPNGVTYYSNQQYQSVQTTNYRQNAHGIRESTIIQCSKCNQVIRTQTTTKIGSGGYTMVCLLCFCSPVCALLPFFMEKCHDVTHSCPQCKADVGIAKYKPF